MDMDALATVFWVVLAGLVLWTLRSEAENRVHTNSLLLSAPAILVFMAAYSSARAGDAWCLGWGIAGIIVSAPIATISVARLASHYVADELGEKRDRVRGPQDSDG